MLTLAGNQILFLKGSWQVEFLVAMKSLVMEREFIVLVRNVEIFG